MYIIIIIIINPESGSGRSKWQCEQCLKRTQEPRQLLVILLSDREEIVGNFDETSRENGW